MAKMILESINKNELLEKSNKKIKESITKAYEETLNEKFGIHQKLIKFSPPTIINVLMFIFLFGIPFIIFKFFIMQKFQKDLVKKINIYEIHKNFFQKTPISGNVKNIANSARLKKINSNSKYMFGVPNIANVYKENPGFKLETQIGSIEYLSIIWKWVIVTNNGKETIYKNVTTALFTPKVDKDLQVFNFVSRNFHGPLNLDILSSINSIFNKSKKTIKMEKVKLESPQFNKKIKIYSDNKLKIRMIYTPYFMEKVLEQNNLIHKKVKKWELQKTNDNYILNYFPIDREHLFINSKTFSFKKNKIINGMIKDAINDFYDFYSTLQLMLFTNLFKF